VNSSLDSVQSYGVMCRVWGEDGDGIARRQLVNGGFVGVRIAAFTFRIGIEGGVKTVIGFGDILL
jgi:hypothetical protein